MYSQQSNRPSLPNNINGPCNYVIFCCTANRKSNRPPAIKPNAAWPLQNRKPVPTADITTKPAPKNCCKQPTPCPETMNRTKNQRSSVSLTIAPLVFCFCKLCSFSYDNTYIRHKFSALQTACFSFCIDS